MNFEKGMLVRSKAGHDKDALFVVVAESGTSLYLADGTGKTMEHPKRKNKKHVQLIHKKLENPMEMCNEGIKDFIRHQSE